MEDKGSHALILSLFARTHVISSFLVASINAEKAVILVHASLAKKLFRCHVDVAKTIELFLATC